jgi:hypothetical protein
VADFGATHHTNPLVDNITMLHPSNSSHPPSIVVGNGSSLPITSVGDSILPGPFYLNNILLAPDMVQSLLSVHCFTTDNWCSMEFDPFDLSVKDLSIRNVIVRLNSTGPLYMMHLSGSTTPSPDAMAALAAAPLLHLTPWPPLLLHPMLLLLLLLPRGIVVSVTLALTPYLACLGLFLFIVPAINIIFVMYVSWVNTAGYPFIAHHTVRNIPLILYILIFGHLLLLVCEF